MRILLSNDDGIDAPGLACLEKIARTLSDDIWIVAPATEQSAASHSLTMRTPLRVCRRDEKIFAVEGTPTDCIVLALHRFMKDAKPDLVLSGVNNGDNTGEDVTYSGTIAAAMEATLLGVKSFAFSQEIMGGRDPDWATAENYGPKVVRQALKLDWAPYMLMSVNFPACIPADVTGIFAAMQAEGCSATDIVERIDLRDRIYYWVGSKLADDRAKTQPQSDFAVMARKGVAITPLHLDLTHRAMFGKLKEAFA